MTVAYRHGYSAPVGHHPDCRGDFAHDGPCKVESAATPSGADLIAAERQRQIDAEGWTTTHDDGAHDSGELVYAAISYAYSPFSDVRQAPDDDYRKPAGTAAPSTWPWEDEWWKPTPKDRVRELTKAGALIAAEIDRLQRAES